MPPHIVVIKGNITDVVADAVVNAANTKLLAGPGVSGAIFDAAGHDNLREVCHSLQPVHTGHAVITPGYASRAKYIIHAVAPRYLYNEASEEMITKQMKDVYKNSLRIAEANRCKSIAFPILGTGTRRYPRRRACREAIEAIHESEHEVNTVLVVAYGTSCFEIFHRELKIFQQGIDHLVQTYWTRPTRCQRSASPAVATIQKTMPPNIVVIKGNIADVVTDAVVNAANRRLRAGSGVSGALFEAAGHGDLREACNGLEPVRYGDAVVTPGFSSCARYIIHAVTPRYDDREVSKEDKTRLLKKAYENSLRIADVNRCKTVAFPILGTGSRGYPRWRACREAIGAIYGSGSKVDTVVIVAHGRENFKEFRHQLKKYKRERRR